MSVRGRRWWRWALAGAAVTAAAWAAAEPFTFAAMGCMPYGKENFAAYERLLAEINRRQPAFTVHCGDTKSGGEPPTEVFLQKVHTWFDSLDGAAIYTPGDNEWTDVHRTSNGSQDPAVWLGKVRAEIEAGKAAEAAAITSPFPMHWSYHMKPERLVDNGFLDLKPDGTLVLGNVNDSTPGKWSATREANVLKVVFDTARGVENCEMRIHGNEAELVRPIGTRYLKAK